MTRTNTWAGVLSAIALTVAAAGCGSDGDGSSATIAPADTPPAATDPVVATPDPPPATDPVSTEVADTSAPIDDALCAVLDMVDLDGLLGEAAGTREVEVDDFGGGCTVVAGDPESRGTVVLRVTTNAAVRNYDNAQEQFGVDAEITGLGDSAFASGPMVVVLSGDRLISLQAVRWADLGIGGVTQTEVETAMTEVLTALGAGTSSAPASAPAQGAASGLACTLLAEIDLAGLIGEPVGPPAIDDSDGTDSCVVEPASTDSTAAMSLTIMDTQAAERFAETEEIFGVDSTVDGLGDEAFHSGPVLAVLDGDRAVVLWIMGDILLGANIDDAELEAAMAQVLAAIDAG